ncbi:hypothetical protein THAOC_27851, partial [Thalassiosira oceanica]
PPPRRRPRPRRRVRGVPSPLPPVRRPDAPPADHDRDDASPVRRAGDPRLLQGGVDELDQGTRGVQHKLHGVRRAPEAGRDGRGEAGQARRDEAEGGERGAWRRADDPEEDNE